jgi:hypothetical protein
MTEDFRRVREPEAPVVAERDQFDAEQALVTPGVRQSGAKWEKGCQAEPCNLSFMAESPEYECRSSLG